MSFRFWGSAQAPLTTNNADEKVEHTVTCTKDYKKSFETFKIIIAQHKKPFTVPKEVESIRQPPADVPTVEDKKIKLQENEILSSELSVNNLATSQSQQSLPNDALIKDDRTIQEQELENDFYKVRKRSATSWEESFYTALSKTSNIMQNQNAFKATVNTSFHIVEKVLRKNKNKITLGFLKHNGINSPVSELETTVSRFYHLFSYGLTPKMHTVYDIQRNIIGVVSKAVKGFKSLREDPIKPTDFKIAALDNHSVTLEELIEIYGQYEQQTVYKLDDKKDDDVLIFKLGQKPITIFASDLKHYEIIRGNAITLVLSYFFEEDDLHRGNLAKDGKRIDFDMSLWRLFTHFKNVGWWQFLNRAARVPHPGQFDITERDIVNFPILQDAYPCHWPTLSKEGYLNMMQRWKDEALTYTGIHSTGLSSLSNVYGNEHKEIYSQLAKHPLFKYFKFHTLLRLSLMTPLAYQAIAEVEINNEVKIIGHPTSIIHDITEHLKQRTEQCREILCNIPEFRDFMKTNGDKVYHSFLTELENRNQLLEARLQKKKSIEPDFDKTYPEFIKQKIDLKLIRENYDALNNRCLELSQRMRVKSAKDQFIDKRCAF